MESRAIGMPPQLWAAVEEVSRQTGRSVNELIRGFVQEGVLPFNVLGQNKTAPTDEDG